MSVASWSVGDLQESVANNDLVLVDMKAPWCPQCGPQVRVLERMAPDYEGKVSFGAIDLADNEEATKLYNVTTLPMLILFKNGEIQQEFRGYTKAPSISQALDKAINSQD